MKSARVYIEYTSDGGHWGEYSTGMMYDVCIDEIVHKIGSELSKIVIKENEVIK